MHEEDNFISQKMANHLCSTNERHLYLAVQRNFKQPKMKNFATAVLKKSVHERCMREKSKYNVEAAADGKRDDLAGEMREPL